MRSPLSGIENNHRMVDKRWHFHAHENLKSAFTQTEGAYLKVLEARKLFTYSVSNNSITDFI